ncbi:MAG TPA: molybdenum cofactor guanylyltransferase [Candidatus Dormibacteraeota bacterium]|nr:molybdenum cofactor guanylyltransferase [Candidatus Dormibacteraeota bacterium]
MKRYGKHHVQYSATPRFAYPSGATLRMTLTAMILTGGASRRMGSDKALLKLESEFLWQRQLRIVQALKPEHTWVSARQVPNWRPANVEVVLDQQPSRGPLSGLVAGLERLRTSHLLALAIDLPAISSEHLLKLWQTAQPGSGVVPFNGQYFEPLCAVYPGEAGSCAIAALQKGEHSLQTMVRSMVDNGLAKVYGLTREEKLLYRNVNEPADLG